MFAFYRICEKGIHICILGHLHLLQAGGQEALVLFSLQRISDAYPTTLTILCIFKTRHMDYCILNSSYLHYKPFISTFVPAAVNQQINNAIYFHYMKTTCYLIKVHPL